MDSGLYFRILPFGDRIGLQFAPNLKDSCQLILIKFTDLWRE